MKLRSSGLILISVLIARSAAQTEAGSGQGEEEEEGGSGSGEGEAAVSTEVINSADYSMTASEGSLEIRWEVTVTKLNISQPSPVLFLGSAWRTGEWTELPSST